jgi:hypothetical protein
MDEDQTISTRLGVAATAGSKRRYAQLGLWHQEFATGLMEEAERVVVLSCFVSSAISANLMTVSLVDCHYLAR